MVRTDVVDLQPAREALREEQARWSFGVFPATPETTAAALQRVDSREEAMVEDGEWLREGIFRYLATRERARFGRTRDVIKRSSPGPFEDANYMALIARQAASIELFLEGYGQNDESRLSAADVNGRIVLGTTGAPLSDGRARSIGSTVVIMISAGMIDFMYQTNKAVVLSWKQIPPKEGTAVGFSTAREDIVAQLDDDPYPVTLLRDTLATWLYDGFPRAPHAKEPPPRYHPPLALLTNGAERFVIAHEYGHALMDQLRLIGPDGSRQKPPQDVSSWERELRADEFATIAVSDSAYVFDLLPTNVALQGAVVSMKAHQVLLRALDTASSGAPQQDAGSDSHPPFEKRLRQLEDWYMDAHPDPEAARADLGAMEALGETIDLLWERAAPSFEGDHRAGRTFAPIWLQ